jgi:hypothetical protein
MTLARVLCRAIAASIIGLTLGGPECVLAGLVVAAIVDCVGVAEESS